MEEDNFVQDKLTEWDLPELIQIFEDEDIDKKAFLNLEKSGTICDLIPKIGPRIKFRKKLREYLENLKRRNYVPEMMDMDLEQDDSTEMEPVIFSLPLETAPLSDTENGNETRDDPIYPGATVTGSQATLAVKLFALRYQSAEQGDLMALLKFLLPSLVVEDNKSSIISVMFYCVSCKSYFGKSPQANCSNCNTVFDRQHSFQNGFFFLYASLKELLKEVLQTHGTKLLPKKYHKQSHSEQEIKDVMDGSMYQDLLNKGALAADDLTLSWNFDEAKLYNSSNYPAYSVWPIQFTLNELPYEERKKNVIVAGLWFDKESKERPKMDTLLRPFIDECQDLALNPFQWRDSSGAVHSSKVFSLVCCSDAVARPLLRNCKQYNGENGCDWCLHPGEMAKKGMGGVRTYPYDKMAQQSRSKDMFEANGRQATDSSPKEGVKGPSLLLQLPFFDIVFGFVPEYMHSVVLGVSKQLMKLWLNSNNSNEKWFVGDQITELDFRLRSLKRPLEISKKPPSLECLDSWKAPELRAFLLFYAVHVLPGILQPSFLKHYLFLSTSIHLLLQESITQKDLELAHQNLVQFVMKMEELYGEEHVSFNCHQLIHLTESVSNWGPLWATSAFSFERNCGNLRALFRGIKYDPEHIYQRFSLFQQIPRDFDTFAFNLKQPFGELLTMLSPVNDGTRPVGESKHVDLTVPNKKLVENLLKRKVLVQTVEVVDNLTKGNTVYRCDESDHFVKLTNGECGEIQLMLLLKENCVCTSDCLCQTSPIIVVHLYNVQQEALFSNIMPDNASNRFFLRVERTNQVKAFFLEDIRCKCIYMAGWLVPQPNKYERY